MFKKILVPIDLQEPVFAEKAVKVAVDLVTLHQAELHVMTVLPGYSMPIVAGFFPEDFETKAHDAATKQLNEFIAAHVPSDVTVQAEVAAGNAYERILKLADKLKIDLIILGAHSPELKDYLLGPNAARVVRHARQSVLVVRS